MTSAIKREEFPFSHRLRVRYAEVDSQGVVFNPHYLNYFEITITEYMRAHVDNYIENLDARDKDFHVAKTTVEYYGPIYFDDALDIHIQIRRVGRSSLTWELAIFRGEEADVLSWGEVIWVYADMKTHKSVPLPAELIQQLTG